MATVHSKASIFKVQNSSNALTDISTYCTKVDWPRTVDKAETSTFGATYKTYVQGLADAQFNVEYEFDLTVVALFDGIILNSSRTFEYGPGGNTAASGQPKYTGSLFIVALGETSDITAEVKGSVTFQMIGAPTVAAY